MQLSLRTRKYIIPILVTVSAVLASLRFNSLQIGTSYDDAHYIILAESLSSGQGYELINFPNPQIERAFPPGWPILLTPLTFLFQGNYTVLKLFSLVLWLASILLIYKLLSRQIESPGREIVAGLIAINPLLVGTSVTVMSESAYLFFSLLALFVVVINSERMAGSTNSIGTGNPALLITASTLIFYTQLIRTIGISLFIAFVLYLILNRRFREVTIPIIIFIIGTLIQRFITGSFISTGYESQVFAGSVFDKAGQMWSNAVGYYNEILSGSIFPIFGSRLTSALGSLGLGFFPALINIFILLLVTVGLLQSVRKYQLIDLYFIIYIFGILTFWNPDVGSVKARFLIPIIPFLYLYLWKGLDRVLTGAFRNGIKFALRIEPIIALGIAFVLLGRNLQDGQNPIMNQITDLSIGASWIAENAPGDAIVMVNEPVPSYVHVKRKTINFPKSGQDLERYLENQGINYIIVAPKLQSPRSNKLEKTIKEDVLPVISSQPDKFTPVFTDGENNVTVYQYKGGIK